MTERGSFITEYIYCPECFEVAKTVLLNKGKYLCSFPIPHWDASGRELPIVAGKIGGMYPGVELDTFESELIPKLKALVCHSLRIAVLPDAGIPTVFTVDTQGREVSQIKEVPGG